MAARDVAVPQVQAEARLLRRRGRRLPRPELEQLEASGLSPADLLPVLAWLVRDEVPIDELDLHAARRRAMLVLAAGGDPHREVSGDDVAVIRLSDELDTADRRAALRAALARLAAEADGLPTVAEALAAEEYTAWRAFALALLADELAEE